MQKIIYGVRNNSYSVGYTRLNGKTTPVYPGESFESYHEFFDITDNLESYRYSVYAPNFKTQKNIEKHDEIKSPADEIGMLADAQDEADKNEEKALKEKKDDKKQKPLVV